MTKLYCVSCCHRLYHHLCRHLCHQLLSCYKILFVNHSFTFCNIITTYISFFLSILHSIIYNLYIIAGQQLGLSSCNHYSCCSCRRRTKRMAGGQNICCLSTTSWYWMTTAFPSSTSVDVATTDNNTTTNDASIQIVVENKGNSDSDSDFINGW